ncbi:MAG: glycosyltransferase [Flavobacteriaceae bacterium]|nr:glycosyltransferase [Flavobacteriaceae bacterium]
MRIGMVLDATFPTDPRVSNEADALIQAGHEVFLFCLSYSKNFRENEILNKINISRYYCSNLTYKLSALAYTFPFYKNIMCRKIHHFINHNNLEALHIHDIQIASSVFKANTIKLPVTLDLHENRPEIMKHYKHVNSILGKLLISPSNWKKNEEKYCKLSNKIIVVTEEAKTELINRLLIDKRKISVYPNTVKKDFYKNFKINNKIIERFSKKFVLLYIGNTSKRRGLDIVIKSLNKLNIEITNLKLVIVGSSSFDKELKTMAIKHNCVDLISFEGWKNERDFASYLSIAKLGLSPLHSNLHHDTTFANKIFQYMSFGCPLICSDVVAQKNIIDKFKVGSVFKSGDEIDFSKKVIELFKDENKRKSLSVNCIDAIEKYLNNDVVSEEFVKTYV